MAAVTEYLFQLIAKQVDDHGFVVWYDPEQEYATGAAGCRCPIRSSPASMAASSNCVQKSTTCSTTDALPD
jgi:hypothetical protein